MNILQTDTESLNRLIKLAEAMGWRRYERLGKEVWYDPAGGHVTWEDLPRVIGREVQWFLDDYKNSLIEIA